MNNLIFLLILTILAFIVIFVLTSYQNIKSFTKKPSKAVSSLNLILNLNQGQEIIPLLEEVLNNKPDLFLREENNIVYFNKNNEVLLKISEVDKRNGLYGFKFKDQFFLINNIMMRDMEEFWTP